MATIALIAVGLELHGGPVAPHGVFFGGDRWCVGVVVIDLDCEQHGHVAGVKVVAQGHRVDLDVVVVWALDAHTGQLDVASGGVEVEPAVASSDGAPVPEERPRPFNGRFGDGGDPAQVTEELRAPAE